MGKIPPIFGSGLSQPKITVPTTPVLPGLTTTADRAGPGDAAGFDLGGFRLGMSEAAIEATMKARGLKAEGVTRFVDFESQVRSAINTRGGQGGAETKRSVLGEATILDDAGGRFMLRMLVWPDGSHLESITYLAPQGTAVAEWRRTLTAEVGSSARGERPGSVAGDVGYAGVGPGYRTGRARSAWRFGDDH